MDVTNYNQPKKDDSSVESISLGSLNQSSCDSLSEGSYELDQWHGKLSMSWESVGSETHSSNLLLAPQSTGQ